MTVRYKWQCIIMTDKHPMIRELWVTASSEQMARDGITKYLEIRGCTVISMDAFATNLPLG